MLIENLPIQGPKVFKFEPFNDSRGSFRRLLCIRELGIQKEIVQINHSITFKKGTIRGMHFQYPPYAETKIIHCIKGAIYDIIIDIRQNSPTFLQWHSVILSSDNNLGIYIPEGFAHGFQTLENNTELIYFHTEFYNKDAEGGLNCLDPSLKIKFPLPITEISERDKSHKFIDKSFKGIAI